MKRTRRNPDVTDTPAFRRWFGDSKVVDALGHPLVVYHGTSSEFWAFDVSAQGRATDAGTLGAGFYFTSSREAAQNYADDAARKYGGEPRVIAAYLSIRKPYRAPRRLWQLSHEPKEARKHSAALRKQGYDGIQFHIDLSAIGDASFDEYVVFKPTQIKSATDNVGTFDPPNADIRHNPRRARRSSALTAREVFQAFQDQTDAGDDYFALFAPYARWTLITIDPATIQSYTEPGAIQHGFKNAGDEATARQYAARGIEHAPPIFVRPYGRDGYAWLHIDGQTRARAAFLSGKPIQAYAPMAIGEVVRKRARHNPDYPNVQVLKGRIVSPEGSILVRKIGEGQFSTAYLSNERTPRVFVVTAKRAKEKEILAQAYALDPKNPHLPKVSRYGFTKTGKTLWTMPYYTMLPKAKTATAARSDAKALTACRAGVFKRKSRRVTSSDALNEAVVDCAQVELASRPLLVRALDALRWAARLHETYLFEFQARNLAIDDKGHLILLDVLFDWKA